MPVQDRTSFAFDDVSKIDVKNAKINSGAEVVRDGIVAFVHDYDAVASFINKPRRSSIYNPRAERTNIFYKATKGYGVDLSENGVVFYLSKNDEEASQVMEQPSTLKRTKATK